MDQIGLNLIQIGQTCSYMFKLDQTGPHSTISLYIVELRDDSIGQNVIALIDNIIIDIKPPIWCLGHVINLVMTNVEYQIVISVENKQTHVWYSTLFMTKSIKMPQTLRQKGRIRLVLYLFRHCGNSSAGCLSPILDILEPMPPKSPSGGYCTAP